MLSKYVWDNITEENYLCDVGPELTDILSHENRLFQIYLVACFLTGYNITEQSWLFLFNVGSGVRLRFAGEQWTGAEFDWNILIFHYSCEDTNKLPEIKISNQYIKMN